LVVAADRLRDALALLQDSDVLQHESATETVQVSKAAAEADLTFPSRDRVSSQHLVELLVLGPSKPSDRQRCQPGKVDDPG
jgi:hypothetical protein